MIKITSLSVAGALLACGLSAAAADAQANRTWVSGNGKDSGACTFARPCQTFAFALTQTNAGGEIDVLDPASYGAVTIAKAISIVNDGVGVAAIGVTSGNAITINAGASDSVQLRGLTIEGLGSGSNGIQLNSGGNLAIENCVIRGFANAGINIAPTGSAAVTGVLRSVITDNNGIGIEVGDAMTLWDRSMSPSSIARLPTTQELASLRNLRPAEGPSPPSQCAIPLPATTGPDFSRRIPFFGSGILWPRGTILESARPLPQYLATATTTSTGTRTTISAL
ncbi:MAG: hypothetical protein ACREDD_04545 [Methylocella sp.]